MWKQFVLLATLALPAPAVAGEKTPEERPRLEVVARYALPAGRRSAVTDIRWASKSSVYLLHPLDGVVEVELAEGLPEVRRVTPAAKALGLAAITNMASSSALVVGNPAARLAWTSLDDDALTAPPKARVKKEAGWAQDIDIRGEEVLLLGSPDRSSYLASNGGVLWRSRLSERLDPWEVLHESRAVAHDWEVLENGLAPGSLRFLRNGEIAVAPNFLPGVLLFSSSGALKKSWTPEELWGSDEVMEWTGERQIGRQNLKSYLSKQRLIEEVLPLPRGPAIVVREPKGQGARWRLAVLGAEIEWYEIPASDITAVARLRGDADERGRIVLVGTPREMFAEALVAQNEVIVLSLPE